MKVRQTFEISNDDRIVINIVENGVFEPASRETIEVFLQRLYDDVVGPARKKLQNMYEGIARDIARQLIVEGDDEKEE